MLMLLMPQAGQVPLKWASSAHAWQQHGAGCNGHAVPVVLLVWPGAQQHVAHGQLSVRRIQGEDEAEDCST